MAAFVCDPGTELQKRSLVSARASNVETPRSIRRAHNAPGISSGLTRVQQDGAQRAAPRRFFVFVGPASLVSQRAAAEKIRLFFSRRWIVDQHHQNLAAIIFGRPLVIVPLLFGR